MTARQKSLTAATRRTVQGLRKTEHLMPADELRVANVMFTAQYLDPLHPLTSPTAVASFVRAHLAASNALFGEAGDENGSDAYTDVIATLSSPLGDASTDQPYRLPDRPPWQR
jgi:hypothetical protein